MSSKKKFIKPLIIFDEGLKQPAKSVVDESGRVMYDNDQSGTSQVQPAFKDLTNQKIKHNRVRWVTARQNSQNSSTASTQEDGQKTENTTTQGSEEMHYSFGGSGDSNFDDSTDYNLDSPIDFGQSTPEEKSESLKRRLDQFSPLKNSFSSNYSETKSLTKSLLNLSLDSTLSASDIIKRDFDAMQLYAMQRDYGDIDMEMKYTIFDEAGDNSLYYPKTPTKAENDEDKSQNISNILESPSAEESTSAKESPSAEESSSAEERVFDLEVSFDNPKDPKKINITYNTGSNLDYYLELSSGNSSPTIKKRVRDESVSPPALKTEKYRLRFF